MLPGEEREAPRYTIFLTPDGAYHLLWTWPKAKKTVMADAVDIEGVKWPRPTAHTFKQMAKSMYECHRHLNKEIGKHYASSYDQEQKDHWFLVAKQAYTVLAKIGGGKIRKIAKASS